MTACTGPGSLFFMIIKQAKAERIARNVHLLVFQHVFFARTKGCAHITDEAHPKPSIRDGELHGGNGCGVFGCAFGVVDRAEVEDETADQACLDAEAVA